MRDRSRAIRLRVRAVLFDLDGTLADTAADLANAVNRVRADRGLPPLALDALRPHASHGARGMLGAAFGVTREDPDFEPLRDAFLAYYEGALCVQSRLFSEAQDVLAEIEARGLSWGIVTNKAARFTMPLLESLVMSERGGIVICGDTTRRAKPHPEPLLAAAKALGVEPAECVYVGDAERDIVAGQAAGMKTLVAMYGYLGEDDAPEGWSADGCIASLRELLDWLPMRQPRAAKQDE